MYIRVDDFSWRSSCFASLHWNKIAVCLSRKCQQNWIKQLISCINNTCYCSMSLATRCCRAIAATFTRVPCWLSFNRSCLLEQTLFLPVRVRAVFKWLHTWRFTQNGRHFVDIFTNVRCYMCTMGNIRLLSKLFTLKALLCMHQGVRTVLNVIDVFRSNDKSVVSIGMFPL